MSGDRHLGGLTAPAASLIDDLTALVSQAAAAIMRIGPKGARMKADRTPVCNADEAAEALLLEGLARLMPAVPVVSEEACTRGARPRTGTRFFLVDPLDGTREFLAGLDEYTVNLALVADGVPELGIIAAPARISEASRPRDIDPAQLAILGEITNTPAN